jgi:hypothetical protein
MPSRAVVRTTSPADCVDEMECFRGVLAATYFLDR